MGVFCRGHPVRLVQWHHRQPHHFTWIASGSVVVEGLILLAFNRHCPLTLLARKYSSSTKANFDIFLPEWLARYNQLIFSVLYVIGLVLVGYRLLL